MKLNPLLEEKPDHGHYTACLSRKEEIDRYCNRAFTFTVLSSVLMIFFTLFTTEFPLLSFLPTRFGEMCDLFPIFLQITELIGISLLSAIACTKRKKALIVLLAYYLALFVISLISGTFPGVAVSFLVGLCGIIFTIKAPSVYSDYEQLKETEGWPHFAIWMTDTDRPKYSYDEFRRRAAEKAEAEKKMVSHSYAETKKRADASFEAARMADEVMRAAEAEAKERVSFDPYEARKAAERAAMGTTDMYGSAATRSMPPPSYPTSDDDMPAIEAASALLGVPEPAMIAAEYTDSFDPM